jgi:phospholipid/cholesterol/gamma-HCH transport system ATP-binding protein
MSQPNDSAEGRALLDELSTAIEEASYDDRLSSSLALADTTVRINLADADGLGVTLLLDRTPIQALNGAADAQVQITMSSSDLKRLWSEDFNLPLAIGRGEVQARGPVRRFLRVAPILSQALRSLNAPAGDPWMEGAPASAPDEESEWEAAEAGGNGGAFAPQREESFGPEDRRLLDQAAEYAYHEGALDVQEERPGDYWSIQFIDAYKRFGSLPVLNGLNFGIPEGMITTVLGPSGVGKTVLLNHIIGLLFPDRGDVLVHGESVPGRSRSELFKMRREFGMLFQDGALFGSMDVYDNVAFPLREHTNKSEREIREIVMHRLDDVGLADAAHRMPNQISGGMRKRAGFARALVLEPAIVMFDEPDSGLDPVRTALLVELIKKLHAEYGGTYIVVTHDIESARVLDGYIALLWKGRIVQAGQRGEMFESDNPFVRQFMNRKTRGPLGMR